MLRAQFVGRASDGASVVMGQQRGAARLPFGKINPKLKAIKLQISAVELSGTVNGCAPPCPEIYRFGGKRVTDCRQRSTGKQKQSVFSLESTVVEYHFFLRLTAVCDVAF